jgi:hypothetical protein
MRISIETGNDGTMVMYLDFEAARAVLASVVFASRFSKRFDPLAEAIERRFHTDPDSQTEGKSLCR